MKAIEGRAVMRTNDRTRHVGASVRTGIKTDVISSLSIIGLLLLLLSVGRFWPPGYLYPLLFMSVGVFRIGDRLVLMISPVELRQPTLQTALTLTPHPVRTVAGLR